MQPNTRETDLLHVRQAATELDVHPSTVRRHIAAGELAAVRLGPTGSLRIRRHALDAFLVDAEPRP